MILKAQWPGVIMSEALWDTPRAWKVLYKKQSIIVNINKTYLAVGFWSSGPWVASGAWFTCRKRLHYTRTTDLRTLSSSCIKHSHSKYDISFHFFWLCLLDSKKSGLIEQQYALTSSSRHLSGQTVTNNRNAQICTCSTQDWPNEQPPFHRLVILCIYVGIHQVRIPSLW